MGLHLKKLKVLESNSTFEVWILLNAHGFHTIVKLKNPKSNHFSIADHLYLCAAQAFELPLGQMPNYVSLHLVTLLSAEQCVALYLFSILF
jgi:hypothetical protein